MPLSMHQHECYNGIVVPLHYNTTAAKLRRYSFCNRCCCCCCCCRSSASRYLYLKLITLLTIWGISYPCLTRLELCITTFSRCIWNFIEVEQHSKNEEEEQRRKKNLYQQIDAQTHQIPIANNSNRKFFFSLFLLLYNSLPILIAKHPFFNSIFYRCYVFEVSVSNVCLHCVSRHCGEMPVSTFKL